MLDYEVASQIEPVLPARAREDGRPTALALRCPAAVLHDHHNDASFVIAEAGEQALLDALVALASAALLEAGQGWQPPQAVDEDAPQRFTDGVRRVIEYLRAGDVFQVNLSRRWSAQFAAPVSPQALYEQLRRANPAPFAGLFSARPPGGQFLAGAAGVGACRPRADPSDCRHASALRGDDDAARIQELVGHPKERAEHVMLIDLERNDLGRICMPGTVVVDELMTVESYAHVHHIVSNVSGHLRPEVTPAR